MFNNPVIRHEGPITLAMTVLTVTAGAVDTVSFLALGQVFTALTTGNLLFLAFSLAGKGSVPAERPALALAAFAVGAALCSVLITSLGHRRWFPIALTAEAVLLAAAGAIALRTAGYGSSNSPAVLGLVALAMGVRFMTAARAAIPGMPTQLIQTSLVKLIDTAMSRWPKNRHLPESQSSDLKRTRYLATLGGIFVGGLLGACLATWGAGRALLTLSVTVLVVAGVYSLAPRYRPPAIPSTPPEITRWRAFGTGTPRRARSTRA